MHMPNWWIHACFLVRTFKRSSCIWAHSGLKERVKTWQHGMKTNLIKLMETLLEMISSQVWIAAMYSSTAYGDKKHHANNHILVQWMANTWPSLLTDLFYTAETLQAIFSLWDEDKGHMIIGSKFIYCYFIISVLLVNILL